MLTHKLGYLLVTFLVSFALAGGGPEGSKLHDTTELPNDHAIYQVSHVFGAGAQRITAVSSSSSTPTIQAAIFKKQYQFGEIIWAKLVLKNSSDKLRWHLSPPSAGNAVATVGVWRCRWDWFVGGDWRDLREIISINKGYRNPDWAQQSGVPKGCYPGVPIVLKPGESYETVVPLNVAQQQNWPEKFGPLWWYGGVGFTEAGHYRVYLQYANLGEVLPFGGTSELQARRPQQQIKPGEPMDLEFRAVVSNPIDFEILPAEGKAAKELVGLIRKFEVAALERNDMIAPPPIGSIPEVIASLDESQAEIKHSLQLTLLRANVSALLVKPPQDKGPWEDMLKQCLELRQRTGQGPLADACALTQCYILEALGRTKEAIELAGGIRTPDAAAFAAGRQK